MSKPFLPATMLFRNAGAITLLLLTGCSDGVTLARSFANATSNTATVEQLQRCRDHVAQAFAQVPLTDINVFSGASDGQGNATVNWRINNGAAGYCRVDSFNNIVEFVVNGGGIPTPSPTPTPSPAPTPSPTPGAFDPQSLVGLSRDQAIATAEQNQYFIIDERDPNRFFMSNGFQQLILTVDPATNRVASVAVRQPTPTPSPTFDPQSLVGLSRDQAITTAEANGYYVVSNTDANRIIMSNGQQQITLVIGRLFNRVNSVEVNTQPTPLPTPIPSPAPGGGREQIIAQLETCRNYVAAVYPEVPYANINVYAGSPDLQGNTIVNWQASNLAAGYCRMNGLNPSIAEFVVENESTQPTTPIQPTDPSRPPVNGLW